MSSSPSPGLPPPDGRWSSLDERGALMSGAMAAWVVVGVVLALLLAVLVVGR